jgi:hypothetical protein
MKQEINITQPEYLVEDWPGKYEVFSWLEYIVTVPNPIFFITTRKPNGAPNANLSSWGFLIGEKGNYSSVIALLDNSHTYQNILREGEWCVCFPSFQHYRQCFETIRLNSQDNDEITDSGFTSSCPRVCGLPVLRNARSTWNVVWSGIVRYTKIVVGIFSLDEFHIWLWMNL